MVFPIECRFCAELEEGKAPHSEGYFRCRHGRFDVKDPFSPGRMIPRYFAWSGIWRRNKSVTASQKACPFFKLHPQVIWISKRDRRKGSV